MQRGTTCTVWRKLLPSYRTRSATLPLSEPLPATTIGHHTTCCKKISVLRSWRWAKYCPKHVELILEINKLLLLHLVGFLYYLPTTPCVLFNTLLPTFRKNLTLFIGWNSNLSIWLLNIFCIFAKQNSSGAALLPSYGVWLSLSWPIMKYYRGTRWSSGEGITLLTGRSRVRFSMVSLEFFTDIILPNYFIYQL